MTNFTAYRKCNNDIIFDQPSMDDVEIAIAKVKRLSPAQAMVLNYLILGFSNKEIAQELQVTPETVKVHCSDIFKKLNVTNRTQAALLGYLTKIRQYLRFPLTHAEQSLTFKL